MPIFSSNHDLLILEKIKKNSGVSQCAAAQNKEAEEETVIGQRRRLIESEVIKFQCSEKCRLKYSITQKGYSHKNKLVKNYIFVVRLLYRGLRNRLKNIIENIENENYSSVYIGGCGDICETCK